MKRIVAMMICLMMVFSIGALAERGIGGGPRGGGMGGPGGRMGGGMMQNDEEIQAVLDQNASKFQQFTFTDEEAGITFEYSLYVPEDYDASRPYPLIMFIPDSTGAGKSAAEIVQQYYGATVWVTDEEQARHASFVLVPAFTGTVTTDNWEADPQIDATVKLIAQLSGEYSMLLNCIYRQHRRSGQCRSVVTHPSSQPRLPGVSCRLIR